jgi:hypothetical protein
MDSLPDFEAMSQAFLASTQKAEQEDPSGEGDSTGVETNDVFSVSVSGQSRAPSLFSDDSSSELEGDYPPKEVAQAIQTLIKRDEK